ncbi:MULTISPECIES: LamG-like jellyroll fold domain-containing protein [unclassified Nonomuraea]|uniref:LamG-like jellyroll fold domain-containing protein n=1 Tax=unclassified Nonomuraea TaxID=2593643 RepID=UPI0033D39D97
MAASLLATGTTAPAQADTAPTESSTPTITTFPRPDDPDAALRAAIEGARKQNKPVAVEAAFTEQSRTWAYPDGHLTTEAYPGAVQLKQPDGSWARVDPTLVEVDGVVKPKLTKADVTFSGGGDQPFATLEHKDKQSLALSWPTALPKPQLNGAQATYVGAAGPTADLVVTATLSGFRQDVILRERPTGPVEFRIPVTTDGMKLGTTKTGGLKLTDDKGKTIASGGAPFMMETATADPAGADEATGTIDTKVTTETDGRQVLVLKPDPAFLSDPKTTYPVTVDPTVGLTLSQDAVYDDGGWATGTFHLNAVGTQAKKKEIRECTGVTCTTRYVYYSLHNRSIIEFGGFSFPGKAIVSAQMQLYGQYVGRCDNWPLTASPATSAWSSYSVSWNNRPSTTSVGASTLYPSCSATSSWHTWDMTSAAQSWAGGTPNNGVELVTTELNWEYPIDDPRFPDNQFWRFDSADAATTTVPKMSVSYLLPPDIPTFTAESIDSLVGNDAISRSGTVKTGYTSRSPDGRKLDYTITVTDATTQVQAPGTPAVAPPSSAQSAVAVTPQGLVAGYGFDEGTGTTIGDVSGSNNNGTGQNIGWADGKFGKALSFNGTSSKVTVPHSASLVLPSGMTMSAWIKPTVLTSYRSVAFKDHTSGVGYGLYASNGTVPSAWMRSGDTHLYVDGRAPLTTGSWTHLAVTHDGTTARLYVNGTEVAQASIGALQDSGGALQIGANTVWSEYFSGLIDELRIYNRAQTAAEIQADMATAVAVPIPGNPPTAPGNLTATAGEGSIALAWAAATDDYGIGGYEVHRSKTADFTPSATTRLTTTTKRTYTNGDLPGTGTYYYKVIALDNTGQAGPPSNQASAYLKTLTFRVANVDSGVPVNKSYELGSPETFRIKVKACISGYPTTCNESPYYRITTDAPALPSDIETGMADPAQPILSGMVNRPSGGPLTAKYYLYDNSGVPVGAAPLGIRRVNGGERGSFQIPAGTVQPGTTYKWQMVACAQGQSVADEVCTSKTTQASFTTPGTPPLPPVGDVRHLTLGKDNVVIKTAKTDPTACGGSPCTVTDDSVIRIGGSGADKTAAMIGFRLDELPDNAVPVEALLDLGTPTCVGGPCPQDTPITITRLDSPVTSETTISTIVETTNNASKYSMSIAQPKADIIGDQYSWLLVKTDNSTTVTFAEATAPTLPSLKIGYTPAGPPSKVQDLSGQPGDGGVIVSWAIPSSTGSLALLEGYEVEAVSSTGGSVRSLQTAMPSATITGLTNGELYTIRVAGKTRFGRGEWESITLTPRALSPSPAKCKSGISVGSLKATVQEYYLRQSGVVEGAYPDVWSSSISAGITPKLSGDLDPSGPVTAKLSLTNSILLEERQGLEKSNVDRTDTSVALSNTLGYLSPDGTPALRATVSRTWVDVKTDKDGNQHSKPSALADTFDYSFTDCGAMRLISVDVDVDVSDMDMVIEGPGPNGCGNAMAVAQGMAASQSGSDHWCGKGKNGETVYGYLLNCDFGQDICRFDSYGKQNIMSGLSFEAGGVLRYSGVHNYTLGGPTSMRIEELQGWSMVKMTPAFKAANQNLVKNIKVKLATTAKFSLTVGSISIDTGVGGIGFSKTSDSATYSADGEAGNLWVQIPVPGKVRPFTVDCEGILNLCWFDEIRHAMNVSVQFPMKGGPTVTDPMGLQSCWNRASTKYF